MQSISTYEKVIIELQFLFDAYLKLPNTSDVRGYINTSKHTPGFPAEAFPLVFLFRRV